PRPLRKQLRTQLRTPPGATGAPTGALALCPCDLRSRAVVGGAHGCANETLSELKDFWPHLVCATWVAHRDICCQGRRACARFACDLGASPRRNGTTAPAQRLCVVA